ncbi:MAG: hypothetical protein WEC59_07085 [Salibacteraceae bacterium]
MGRLSYHRFFKALYFLITGLIVIAPALYNRYPLMYSDSGAYIEMAAQLEPSFHRSMGYPLLMNLTGLMISNWPIVLLQGLLSSFLIFRIIRSLKVEKLFWSHFFTILTMSFGSALSWYAAQLMPDIWTFILVLAFGGLLLEPKLKWPMHLFYGLVIYASLIVHLSHIPLYLLLLCSLVAVYLLVKKKPIATMAREKWIGLGVPLVGGFITLCSINAVHGHGFRLSLASNVFIAANLGEMGILKFYLDEQCDQKELMLCEWKDNLPKETGGYLWDPNGPVQKHPGGWEDANNDLAPIVHDFIWKPRYLKWFIVASVKATFKQMFQVEIGSGLQRAYGEGTPPFNPMKNHFKQEFNEYLTSVQNKGDELPISFFRAINYITLFMSFLLIGKVVLERKLPPAMVVLLLVFCAAYFFNAAITGILANVYERLQVRLLPLIHFFAILVYLKLIDSNRIASEH